MMHGQKNIKSYSQIFGHKKLHNCLLKIILYCINRL